MSRCAACDVIMTDFEMTRKDLTSGKYVDLCNRCFSTIADQMNVKERRDLSGEDEDDEAYF